MTLRNATHRLGWCVVLTVLAGTHWHPPHLSRRRVQHAKTIRVALYADEGVTKKGLPQVSSVCRRRRFEVNTVTAEEIRDRRAKEFDVLIHPGGSGSKQAETLGDEGRERGAKVRRAAAGNRRNLRGRVPALRRVSPGRSSLLDARRRR